MSKEEMEFWEYTAELAELIEFGGELRPACRVCKYAGQCEREELWWGCSAWEQSMGEDL